MTDYYIPILVASENSSSLIRTFGPPLITGTITMLMAGFALKVSLSQRTIAKNKYNLDMFDKRWGVFEDFYKEYKFYNEINILSDFPIGEKINDIKKILLKAERFFEDITLLDFHILQENIVELNYVFTTTSQKLTERAEIELHHKEFLPIYKENYRTAIQNSDFRSQESIKERIDQMQLYLDSDEMTELYHERRIALKTVNDHMQTIYDRMDKVLKVPHKPY
ncbi:hypothetical protein KBX73_14865 [Acetobacter persici]|uniref:hypothetical protein n=1 Tax=Acetobacter persici TaxID=1076596 RepID=UPI0020CFA855|nr:hypothetical protein [Acetobacter persici]MCP9321025.1 hypothetical protein [Acetobacter persici]